MGMSSGMNKWMFVYFVILKMSQQLLMKFGIYVGHWKNIKATYKVFFFTSAWIVTVKS